MQPDLPLFFATCAIIGVAALLLIDATLLGGRLFSRSRRAIVAKRSECDDMRVSR